MLTGNLTYSDVSIPHPADYGIAANDNTSDVVSNIRQCLLDYCSGTEDKCGQTSNTTFYTCYDGLSFRNAGGCFIEICLGSPDYLNPDVGGIGVRLENTYSIHKALNSSG